MHRIRWVVILVLGLTVISCGRKDVNRSGDIKLRGESPVSLKKKKPGDFLQRGIASWYGEPFHGRKTASGETYDMWARTAAHKTLPLGTLVRVENRENGRSTVVRITDRGPFVRGRIIDLSRRAADDLGMIGTGTAKVALYLTDQAETRSKRATASSSTTKNKNRKQPSPSSEEAPVSSGYWTVQVGAFAEFQRARALVVRLENCGQKVMIDKADGLYRVRVGMFETQTQARDFCDRLASDGLPCWITLVTQTK